MFDKLYQSFHKSAKAGNVLILFLACLAFASIVMPWASSQLKSISNRVTQVELPFSYTTDQLYSILKTYGSQGREWYTLMQLTIFSLYPLIYSMLTGLLILLFYSRLNIKENLIKFFFLMPVFSLLADWLENVCMVVVLVNYPYKLETVVQWANVCSQIKWIFLLGSISLATAGSLLLFFRFIRLKLIVKSIPR